MEAVTDRAEGQKPVLAIAFTVVRNNPCLFPYEQLYGRKIYSVFGEVGFAFRLIPFVRRCLIVYTNNVVVNNKIGQ
jgi:hypothetical protein